MAIQRADPETRRLVLWTIVCGAGIGSILLLALERSWPAITAWLTETPDQTAHRAQILLALAGIASIAPLGALAVYLWVLSRRIARAGMYPLPSMKLIKDTEVVSGPAAESRSLFLKAVAVLLGALGLGLLGMLWWLASWFRKSVG